jgi:M6 family metalloprotease-like protein
MDTVRARVAILAAASLASAPLADIVWDGKRVPAWPPEAFPERAMAARTQATSTGFGGFYPSPKGVVRGVALLVDFSDDPAPVTKQNIDDWLNKKGFSAGGASGSVRDYYLEVSNGQVDFQNEVFGWYRAKKTKAYYDGATDYSRAAELMKEVIAAFDAEVDFSRYDNDKDGSTEAVSIIFAGAAKNWAQGIWPHAGWTSETRDKTRIPRYQMSSMPGKYSVYVMIHECGHMIFGWPDLYYYGSYSAMGNHSDDLKPVGIDDYLRADQGWIPTTIVEPTDTGIARTAPGQRGYVRINPRKPKEGFFWSYIRNTGRNALLAGSGLLMVHYDQSIDGNATADQLTLRVVQADGKTSLQAEQWPSPGSDKYDLFQSTTYRAFSDGRYTSARWYDGLTSGVFLSDVGAIGDTLSYRLGQPLPPEASSIVLEAESALVVSAKIVSNTAATAGRYVGSFTNADSRVGFVANLAKAGLCSLVVRYANGASSDASLILARGSSRDTIRFRPTGAAARFDSIRLAIPFAKGRNDFAFLKGAGQVDLDRIRLFAAPSTGTSPHPGSVSRLLARREAGAAVLVVPPGIRGDILELRAPDGALVERIPIVDGLARPSSPMSGSVLTWVVRGEGGIRAAGRLTLP